MLPLQDLSLGLCLFRSLEAVSNSRSMFFPPVLNTCGLNQTSLVSQHVLMTHKLHTYPLTLLTSHPPWFCKVGLITLPLPLCALLLALFALRLVDREACVWHGAGGTPEKEWKGNCSANRGVCHDASRDWHEGRGKEVKTGRGETFIIILLCG